MEREGSERAHRGSDVISEVNSFTAGTSFYKCRKNLHWSEV